MKGPLEPIPTEQLVIVKNNLPSAEIKAFGQDADGPQKAGRNLAQLDKAYPWLLGASTCLSAMLCWMYVTKPVITTSNAPEPPESMAPTEVLADSSLDPSIVAAADVGEGVEPKSPSRDLVPSEKTLPGLTRESGDGTKVAGSATARAQSNDPGDLVSAPMGNDMPDANLGWETTNLKVQHILSADSGNGELEKIVINVPVLYETRTMRWSPADVAKARTVLARLMIYERNLSNLRQEGQTILKDWNSILENTVPGPALRADSPSLPYNHGQGSQPDNIPESSSSIKVGKVDQ